MHSVRKVARTPPPFAAGGLALHLLVAACASPPATSPSIVKTSTSEVSGPWADEFDGPIDTFPNPAYWTYDLGSSGNGELQQYTANRNNVRLDGMGHLVIRVESADGTYTSARLKTQGLRLARFGRIEARIKVPVGKGIWPAFWMLGASFNGSNWPECGEIDVMELRGSQPTIVYGTVHGQQYSGQAGISAAYNLPSGASFADDFHRFTIQWEARSIRFLVDDIVYQTLTPQRLPLGAQWVFDQQFFLLLNVAVGGGFAGPPDASTQFPQQMLVDYVRYSP